MSWDDPSADPLQDIRDDLRAAYEQPWSHFELVLPEWLEQELNGNWPCDREIR